MNKTNLSTLSLHAGVKPDPTTLSRAIPIHRTSSFVFKNSQHAADLFTSKDCGFIYTRLGNPTQEMLETKVTVLEGGGGIGGFCIGYFRHF